MKPYLVGAMILWLVCGFVGAWLEGQQSVNIATVASGPFAFWSGLNRPVD